MRAVRDYLKASFLNHSIASFDPIDTFKLSIYLFSVSNFLDSGAAATVYCSDYSKKSGLIDNLKVQVVSSKMSDYLTTKEY